MGQSSSRATGLIEGIGLAEGGSSCVKGERRSRESEAEKANGGDRNNNGIDTMESNGNGSCAGGPCANVNLLENKIAMLERELEIKDREMTSLQEVLKNEGGDKVLTRRFVLKNKKKKYLL
jgi:hypothetical protein